MVWQPEIDELDQRRALAHEMGGETGIARRFMVGLETRKQGIPRGGAKMICTTYRTRMPWISIVIRETAQDVLRTQLGPSAVPYQP